MMIRRGGSGARAGTPQELWFGSDPLIWWAWTTDLVYYVQRADGLIKIGHSRSVDLRIGELQRRHGRLNRLATHWGGDVVEQAMHGRFGKLRVAGEWFRPERPLLDHIEMITSVNGLWPR